MKKYFQKRYTLAFFIGILAGIFGAIVKNGVGKYLFLQEIPMFFDQQML
ncbi:hypothetical protein THJ048_00150 [Campylobacter jejuni]|nr:hypothetical protein THJ048_00150 [Campylobacter jejuni]